MQLSFPDFWYFPLLVGLLCTVLFWTSHTNWPSLPQLDNVPFGLGWYNFVAALTHRSSLGSLKTILAWKGPKRHNQHTAARSQFRGVGQCKRHYRSLLFRTVLLGWTFGLWSPLWGEGCIGTMADTGVDHGSTKTHGDELRLTLGSHQPRNNRNHILKRSYKRALRRVQRHGYTWYRGRLFSGTINPNQHSSPREPGPSPNVGAHNSKLRQRLTSFSWNTGGMSQSSWDHFQQWVTSSKH